VPISQLLFGVFSIILIDLTLAGDNALVIAMAVRSLPRRERRIGTACGAAGAVLLRIALTIFAARLLSIRYVQLAGGLFIVWIAVKVLVDASDPPIPRPPPNACCKRFGTSCSRISPCPPTTFWPSPSLERQCGVDRFGLAVSIPFVVFAATCWRI